LFTLQQNHQQSLSLFTASSDIVTKHLKKEGVIMIDLKTLFLSGAEVITVLGH
jgi:hypothetical protein